MEYIFKKEDFERAIDFAIRYYLDPRKSPAGRTSAEPRGLGAVMDAFIRGKLIEIAVKKFIEDISTIKEVLLDFDIKSTYKVKDEADIVGVKESEVEREPNLFIEIKNTSINDRWIGLTDEQLNTMISSSGGKDVIIIYASIITSTLSENPNCTDLVGMYLKDIAKSDIFNEFEDLNAKAKLEFILSAGDLDTYGTKFLKNELLYETNLFLPIRSSIHKKDGSLKKNIRFEKKYESYEGKIEISNEKGKIDKKAGIFLMKGSFKSYLKQNPKSQRNYIYSITDCEISNDIFGSFFLEKHKYYELNMKTLGRDPVLKRNNLWISKKRIYELIEQGFIDDPAERIKDISQKI